MATGNSGTIYSAYMPAGYHTIRAAFQWSLSNINAEAGTANMHYVLYMNSNDSGTYSTEYKVKGVGDRNYFNINGNRVYTLPKEGSGTRNDPFIMYAELSKDEKYNGYYATQPSYTFYGYVWRWGKLAEGDMTIYYDDAGNASFSVYGSFQCFTGSGTDDRVYINDTIYVNQIERFSKVYLKSGGSWDKSRGRIWHKDSDGVWRKKSFFHRESGSWNKKL